jgi:hypothetical protein
MSDIVYVLTEHSAVGDTVLGVFSTIEEARHLVPANRSARLEDYRIQALVLGAAADPRTPWIVILSRDGDVESAELAVT